MDSRAPAQYPDPEMGTGSSGVWDSRLLTVNRSKELPKLRQNQVFWTKRKCAIITTTILIILVAAIVIGVVAGVLEKHHTTTPSPNSVSSPDNSLTPTGPISTPTSPSSLSSAPIQSGQPIPSSQPIPAALATAFRSSTWIWLGSQALTGVPGGDWAFRKTLPTSTTPATQAVALLTVDNGFQLYHNGQLIAANIDTDTLPGWQMATAVHIDLDPNSNVFAIQAHNSPADTDPNGNSSAGLLASIQVSYADGTTAIISSDTTWRAAQPIPSGFQLPSFNDTQWQLATALAKYGFGPWATQVTIPPSYNFTTR